MDVRAIASLIKEGLGSEQANHAMLEGNPRAQSRAPGRVMLQRVGRRRGGSRSLAGCGRVRA
jgi:hypothetical protein